MTDGPDASTLGYWLGLALASIGSYAVGLIVGIKRGEAHNWLAPLVREQAEALRKAWTALDSVRR
jgi:hypothetical protein